MTTARTMRRLVFVLALTTQLALPWASRAGERRAATAEMPIASPSSQVDGRDDPRLRRPSKLERALRPLGDAVFARPVHLAQLVVGVAMLPIALPIAALFADPRDALDICVSGPYEMAFRRPLGE